MKKIRVTMVLEVDDHTVPEDVEAGIEDALDWEDWYVEDLTAEEIES